MIEIRGDLATSGGEGVSLVKGVQARLKAIALSIQAGGYLGTVEIGGRCVRGGIYALGQGSDAVHTKTQIRGLETISVDAKTGRGIVSSRPDR